MYAALEKVLTFPFIEGCRCVNISQIQSKHLPHLCILSVYRLYFSCLSIVKCSLLGRYVSLWRQMDWWVIQSM